MKVISLNEWIALIATVEIVAIWICLVGAVERSFPNRSFRSLPVALVGWTTFLIISALTVAVVDIQSRGIQPPGSNEGDQLIEGDQLLAFLTTIGIVASYAAALSVAHNLRNRFFDGKKPAESKLLLTNWINVNATVLVGLLGFHVVLIVLYKGRPQQEGDEGRLFLSVLAGFTNLLWFAHAFGSIPAIAVALEEGRSRIFRSANPKDPVREAKRPDPIAQARLATQFPTVNEWLTRYTRFVMGCNFRTWMGLLRRNGIACFVYRPLQSVLVTLLALGNSLLSWITHWRYGSEFRAWEQELRSKENPLSIVFITGHWRSGTTLLHELLVVGLDAVAPTNWECFAPHAFPIIGGRRRSLLPVGIPSHRPIDQIAIEWDTPQEDEFGLFNLGFASPYESIVFPRSSGSLKATRDRFETGEGKLSDYLIPFLARILTIRHHKPVAGQCKTPSIKEYREGARAPIIVLKSPLHTLRTKEIRSTFPGAYFLEIRRNVFEVYVSTWRLWRDLIRNQGLEPFPVDDHAYEGFVRSYMRIIYESTQESTVVPKATIRFKEIDTTQTQGGDEIFNSIRTALKTLDGKCERESSLASQLDLNRARLMKGIFSRKKHAKNEHEPMSLREVEVLRDVLKDLDVLLKDDVVPEHLGPVENAE